MQTLSIGERRGIIISIVLALILIVAVWVFTAQDTQSTPVVAEANRPAPDFDLPSLDGESIRLSDYRGHVVLLNFWGTWCDPCRRETPEIQAAYEQLADQGVMIIGINLTVDELAQGRTEEDIQEFASSYGITYPIGLDRDGAVARSYGIFPIPTSLFIDPEGNIRYMRFSEVTTDDIVSLVAELQQAGPTVHEGQ